jgi:hypothetical protein
MMTLAAFSVEEKVRAKRLLASRVAQMMGRKFEEGDWSAVYCRAKGIPDQGWSNLHIDVVHDGLGVEHKMLCVGEKKPLMSLAGTTLMHPAATRSIRIGSTDIEANAAMRDVLGQYRLLIEQRTARVAEASDKGKADMRTGWLIWERSLTEFVYFEERMAPPDDRAYWAEWHETPARGVRKPSKNLWIYEKATNKKRYSVTTNAGAKIQPYFDVPAPNDPNLVFLRVQGEEIAPGRVLIWVNGSTARELHRLLDTLKQSNVSEAIIRAGDIAVRAESGEGIEDDLAQPIEVTAEAYTVLVTKWGGVSDEHRAQLLIQTLRSQIA